jgi:hypothetical protein
MCISPGGECGCIYEARVAARLCMSMSKLVCLSSHDHVATQYAKLHALRNTHMNKQCLYTYICMYMYVYVYVYVYIDIHTQLDTSIKPTTPACLDTTYMHMYSTTYMHMYIRNAKYGTIQRLQTNGHM